MTIIQVFFISLTLYIPARDLPDANKLHRVTTKRRSKGRHEELTNTRNGVERHRKLIMKGLLEHRGLILDILKLPKSLNLSVE